MEKTFVYIPDSIDLDVIIDYTPPEKGFLTPAKKEKFKQKVAYVIDQVLESYSTNVERVNKTGYAPLHSKRQEKFLGHDREGVLNWLINTAGIIVRDESTNYSSGNYSYGYKIASWVSDSTVKEIEITDYTFKRKFTNPKVDLDVRDSMRKESKANFTVLDSIEERLNFWLNSDLLTLDYSKSKSCLENEIAVRKNYKSPYQIAKTSRSLKKFDSGNRSGWFDHSIRRFHWFGTYTNKEFRRFLLFNGKRLVELDFANFQPLLQCGMFLQDLWDNNALMMEISDEIVNSCRAIARSDRYNDELEQYRLLTQEGRLYHWYEKECELKMSYDELKECVLKSIYSSNESRNGNVCKLRRVQYSHFPTLYYLCWLIKKENYKNLARLLQRMETTIMYQHIVYSIFETYPQIPIYTIHDSILTTEEFIEPVYDIMTIEIQNNLNINPLIRIKEIS